MSFKDDVRIDHSDLPSEWLKHPVIYMEYASQLVDVQFERDKLRDELERVAADVDAEVRAAFAGEKVTETLIKKQVAQHDEYTEAKERLRDAEHRVDILQSGLRALDQKRISMEYLSKYELSGWHSEPKIPEEYREKKEREARRANPPKLGLNKKKRA